MKRTLQICATALAIFGLSTATTETQTDADLACLVSDGDVKFNLTALEKTDGTEYSDSAYKWNFCSYLPETDYFAYHIDLRVGVTPLTSHSYAPEDVKVIRDENDKKVGVSYTRESLGEECVSEETGANINYRFTTDIMCDETITEQGGAQIVSNDLSNDCAPRIVMKHSAGCYLVTEVKEDTVESWFDKHKTIAGVIYIVYGALIATLGKRLFPFIGAKLAAIAVFVAVVDIFAAFELTATGLGVILTILLATGLAIIAGMVVRKHIWSAFTVVAVIGGLAFGNLIFDSLLAVTSLSNFGYYVIVGVFGFMGFSISQRFGKEIALYGTSLIGSFAFVRGWSFFLPGWPTDYVIANDVANGEKLQLTWQFGVYLLAIAVLFALTSWWQHTKEPHHEETEKANVEDDYEKV